MDIAGVSIQKKTVTLVLTAALAVGGLVSFLGLGQLEDPEITIFTAIVQTSYPGASPEEVELEVTDRLETAIQTMGQVEEVTSISRAGLSLVIVDLFTHTDQDKIPQAWDELRRKVGDAQGSLPPGAGPSLVNDDWGDVYGALFAITGEGYSLADIEEYAKLLRRELLMVEGVGAVELWGVQTEAVYVEVSRAKMAQLGVSPYQVFGTLSDHGAVVPDGRLHVDEQYVRVAATGAFDSLDEMGDVLIRGMASGSMIRLDDVATIRRGYLEPPQALLLLDGQPAIGIGIATVEGGHVVNTGRAVMERLAELEVQQPVGMALHPIYFQADVVSRAVNGFLVNLVEALVIVICLLMIFMGLRSGLLIGAILLLDILGTFIYMSLADISLQRISLGALIIALGMLVDNAIVVTEGLLVRLQRGMDRVEAARESVRETMWPLLGATVVAILAFAAISVSEDASGEFLSSLFLVVAASLLLSWVLAVTVTPLLGVMFLDAPSDPQAADPYDRPFFHAYRRLLANAVRRRWLTLGAMAGLLVIAILGFGFVKQSFFPDSGQPQFYIDFWRPEGTHIRDSARDARTTAVWLLEQDGVESVAAFVGRGASRFMLTYMPEMPSSAYTQLLITVDDADRIDDLREKAGTYLATHFPDVEPQVHRFVFGPGGGAKIAARFKGDDPELLRGLAEQAKAIMRADPNTKDVRDDWRQRVPVIRPQYIEPVARQAGVSRNDLASSLRVVTSGAIAGLYREGDTLLPIVFQLPEAERSTVDQLDNAQVWSSVTGRMVPVNQVVSDMKTEWEDPIIRRHNRRRTITVMADPRQGVASPTFERLRPQIEALELPAGYALEWGGEYESSTKATRMLLASVPLFFTLMILIVVALFNTTRQPLIVFLTVPLAVIGVTLGLLVTGQAFGFVALLGFLSLSGMLIKNSVVLLDQIDINLERGQPPSEAVLDAGVSRLRPVSMAAFTTVLGMTPLVFDIFWRGMAVTIMAGLTFATVLTLVVVPVLYATLYRVPAPAPRRRPGGAAVVATMLLMSFMGAPSAAAEETPTARIGIVTDGPNSREDWFVDRFREELKSVAAGSFTVEFPNDAVVSADWTPDAISGTMDAILARPDLDAILVAGVGAAADMCRRDTVPTPVVMPFAFEGCPVSCPRQPDLRVRPLDLGLLVARDLRAFREITPFARVALLMDPTWPSACGGTVLADRVAPEGTSVELVVVDDMTADLAERLPEGTDAVYLMPLLRADDAAFERLVRGLTERGLPTFSLLGESEVDRGVLAGLNTRATMAAFARGAALDVLDLLEGRGGGRVTPAEISGQLTLNMVTAQALGFSPSWELLTRARLLHDEGFRRDRPVDLATAMSRAVEHNLDLAVRDRRVAAGSEDIRDAKSAYRPHLDVGLGAAQIDENHAIAALGNYPRYAAGSLTLTQLIYSDDASANISIQEDLQRVRELDWQALRLDIARDAVAAYMGVMRTTALIDVRQEQVGLTRTNLELARQRRSLGASGAAEVHRWEAELATARAGLLDALSLQRQAERQLSRLLNEPLTTRWAVQKPEMASALQALGGADEVALLATPDGYDRLTTTLVAEAMAQAPELAALQAAISAQERALTAANRARYIPSVGIQASLNQILAKDASGGLDLGDLEDIIPEFDDTSWQVGIQATLPVLTGGANKARRIKASEELTALRVDHHNAREKLAQRTLSALDTATASWSTMSLRRQAADAATETQKLVQDSYARGAASILQLLDAQNNALTSNLAAVTAVYDFLDDWAEVQRSIAKRPDAPEAGEAP